MPLPGELVATAEGERQGRSPTIAGGEARERAAAPCAELTSGSPPCSVSILPHDMSTPLSLHAKVLAHARHYGRVVLALTLYLSCRIVFVSYF